VTPQFVDAALRIDQLRALENKKIPVHIVVRRRHRWI
jgi:hypothetical protein